MANWTPEHLLANAKREIARLEAANAAKDAELRNAYASAHSTYMSKELFPSTYHSGGFEDCPTVLCVNRRAALSDTGEGKSKACPSCCCVLGTNTHCGTCKLNRGGEGWLEVREQARRAIGHAFHLIEHNKTMCVRCREAKQRLGAALDALEAARILAYQRHMARLSQGWWYRRFGEAQERAEAAENRLKALRTYMNLPDDMELPIALGVGDGRGQQFVYGGYEATKTAQEKLIGAAEQRALVEELRKAGVTDYSALGHNRVDCHFCNGVWRADEPAKHKKGCPLALTPAEALRAKHRSPQSGQGEGDDARD